MEAGSTVPLACVPGAIAPGEREAHFALAAELFGAAQERREVPEGYAFRLAPEWLERAARFVANERRCCPFLEFTLTAGPGETSVWLRLTGPRGTRELLDAELRS